MNTYYVYAYIREKDSETARAGTPYYIGYGKNRRAYSKHHRSPVPTDSYRIVILEKNLSEIGAKALERRLIRWWGRKDIDTGILLNRTDGGDGTSGVVFSDMHKKKLSLAKMGVSRGPRSLEDKTKISLATRGKKQPPHSEDTKRRLSEVNTGKILSDETKRKISESKKGVSSPTKGTKWWNNGKDNKRSVTKPGDDFREGFLYKNLRNDSKIFS